MTLGVGTRAISPTVDLDGLVAWEIHVAVGTAHGAGIAHPAAIVAAQGRLHAAYRDEGCDQYEQNQKQADEHGNHWLGGRGAARGHAVCGGVLGATAGVPYVRAPTAATQGG
ncbi:MAG: hypothetical protein H6977_05085 [Gammaproteobacteria bacterium]|nr:hypothetical protein [Gammaproteobacteria bacterium]MCP5199363.1 hypothetical protein [Gammaproteobacteria bacterium]